MKKLFIILIFINIAFANNTYHVTYGSMTLGDIKDINTIKKGYLIAVPSNSFIKFVLGFDKYVIYENDNKPNLKGDVKYKKDKYLILSLINSLSKNKKPTQTFAKDNQSITINCQNNLCTYVRRNLKNKKEYKGTISFNNHNQFISICDNQDDICIKQ